MRGVDARRMADRCPRGRRRRRAPGVDLGRGPPRPRRRLRRLCGLCPAGRSGLARTATARHGTDATPTSPPIFPAAGRMQRATTDLLGHRRRRRGRHAAPGSTTALWPDDHPLRDDARAPAPAHADMPSDYPFVRVEGDGVHEIAVGPVHAGIIEPGHFRFSVVGEKVLRLEAAPGLHAQGHRPPLHATAAARGVPPGGPGLGRLDGGLCLGLLHGARVRGRLCGPGAGALAACADARARTGRESPRRPRRARQRRRAGLRAGPVLAPARRLAAAVAAGLRPPLDDGLRGARWREWRCRRPDARSAAPAVRCDRARGARAAQDLRRTRRPAGPLHRHRPRHARNWPPSWA